MSTMELSPNILKVYVDQNLVPETGLARTYLRSNSDALQPPCSYIEYIKIDRPTEKANLVLPSYNVHIFLARLEVCRRIWKHLCLSLGLSEHATCCKDVVHGLGERSGASSCGGIAWMTSSIVLLGQCAVVTGGLWLVSLRFR